MSGAVLYETVEQLSFVLAEEIAHLVVERFFLFGGVRVEESTKFGSDTGHGNLRYRLM